MVLSHRLARSVFWVLSNTGGSLQFCGSLVLNGSISLVVTIFSHGSFSAFGTHGCIESIFSYGALFVQVRSFHMVLSDLSAHSFNMVLSDVLVRSFLMVLASCKTHSPTLLPSCHLVLSRNMVLSITVNQSFHLELSGTRFPSYSSCCYRLKWVFPFHCCYRFT